MSRTLIRLCCGFIVATASVASAGELTTATGTIDQSAILRIEEDWIAYVSNPDAATAAPQIVNVISPTQSTDGVFGMIRLAGLISSGN